MKYFLLSSFSLMSLIIIVTALVYLFAIKKISFVSHYKKWLQVYFTGLLLWHGMGFISGGLYDEWREITYRYTNTLFNTGVVISCVSLLQVVYLFPEPVFEKERKIIYKFIVGLSGAYLLTIIWFHFIKNQDGADSTSYGTFVNLIAGIYSLILNLCVTVVNFRKGFYFKKKRSSNQIPAFLLGYAQLFFILISLLFIYPGSGHPVVLPLYIYGFWILLQLQSILFIVFSVFPVPFQTKIIGFTLATVMAILSVTIMVMVNFTTNADTIENITQRMADQSLLWKLLFVILGAVLFILLIFPLILKKNFTEPLLGLMDGIKKADAGNLEVHVKEGVEDEIGVVTRNFNKMVHSLRVSQSELENHAEKLEVEVEHRTSELKQSLENLKATQSQLIQAEKMASLGELTAGIAHEIQNPLNFVNNFSEVSQELIDEMKVELDKGKVETAKEIAEDLNQNLEKINHHGKRADAIVKGMLQHSRSSTGQKELTDINALCDEYLRLAYHGIRAKDSSFNVTLETDFDDKVGHVLMQPQEMGRVILNLINNALYAVGEKKKGITDPYIPTVKISTIKKGQYIEIRVADNGKGIPASVKEKIFQPFFTTKPTGQGTGLGLSLSYDIVKAHGGSIAVESAPEKGTVFVIQIPVS